MLATRAVLLLGLLAVAARANPISTTPSVYDEFDAYEAEDDETPQQIAANFNVDVNELLKLNSDNYEGLAADTALLEGTMLLLPKNYQDGFLMRRGANSTNGTNGTNGTPSGPTPSPTPPLLPSTVITQSVTFTGLTVASYTGTTQDAYETGYADSLGLTTSSRRTVSNLAPGVSVSSSATAANGGADSSVGFNANLDPNQGASGLITNAQNNANGLTSSGLQGSITNAISSNSALSSAAAPTVGTVAAPVITPVPSTGAPTAAPVPVASSSGLSNGAIAGIVIGSIIGVVLIVGIIAYFAMGSSSSAAADPSVATESAATAKI